MKYTCYDSMVPQESRKEFNEKILYLIDNDRLAEFQISDDDIYNAYTGIGGLHGLNRSDYDNYAEYSDAKKEIENGQFLRRSSFADWLQNVLLPQRMRL